MKLSPTLDQAYQGLITGTMSMEQLEILGFQKARQHQGPTFIEGCAVDTIKTG